MKDNYSKQRKEFDILSREMNKIYGDYANLFKISDSTCWILYCLYDSAGKKYTQKQVCDEWSYSRQTVNSALKKLEKEGFVFLETAQDNKSKYVNLTKKGEKIAEEIIKPLIECEIEAFCNLEEGEAELFLNVLKKINLNLGKAVNKVICEKTKEEQYEQKR